MIPATAMVSVFLFGIEELATQLEEPFTILPMQAFCDKIYNWCTEIVSWQAGDNGMTVRAPKPEHTVAFLGDKSGRNAAASIDVSSAVDTPVAKLSASAAPAEEHSTKNGGKRSAIRRFIGL